jgi:hypothetical protein
VAGGQIVSTGPFQTIMSCLLNDRGTGSVERAVAGAGSYLNTWRHVVRTYTTASNQQGIITPYLNGVAGTPTNMNTSGLINFWNAPFADNSGAFGPNWYMLFGAEETQKTFQNSTAGWFAGRYGVMRMYNRALTLAEIQQNFNATRGRYNL